jgi:RHS repeat-associated protein
MVPDQARAELFRFDPRGNIHEADRGAPARRYGPGNRLLQKGASSYAWDDDGRLIEKRTRNGDADEVWRYRWNAAGLLREVERPDGGRVRFAYDPFARRVAKEVLAPRPGASFVQRSRTRFVWDGDVLAHELREAASESGDPVVEERTYLYEDDSFEPLAHRERGRWVHYLNDQIGTPERLLEGAGNVACELRKSAWGETEVAPGSTASTPIRFQGQYADEETGLEYNRWRYYDSEAGRFASADPIGPAGGQNPWAFPPNMCRWVDPFGLAYHSAKRVPGGVAVGPAISQKEALARLRNANPELRDVYADSKAEAKRLAKAADRGCKPEHNDPHVAAGPGAKPHYHPGGDHDEVGHVFYG